MEISPSAAISGLMYDRVRNYNLRQPKVTQFYMSFGVEQEILGYESKFSWIRAMKYRGSRLA